MQRRRLLALLSSGGAVTLAGCQVDPTDGESDDGDQQTAPADDEWPAGTFAAEYERTTVTVVADDGSVRGELQAVIPTTEPEIEIGLAPADSLPADGGMLVIYDRPGTQSYEMQDMSFGVDLLFADSSREITTIHSAPAPGEAGSQETYTGDGQYVLIASREWAADHSIRAGDQLTFNPEL